MNDANRTIAEQVPNGADRRLNVLFEWIESGQSPYTEEGTIVFLKAIYNDLLGVGGDEVTRHQGDDGFYDADHADLPRCGLIGVNGSGLTEQCIRREGHPGDHFGMGSE